MNVTKRILGSTMMALLLLAAAAAQGEDLLAPKVGKVIELQPTKRGVLVNAVGVAQIAIGEKEVETFGAALFSDAPDGALYIVEVTTPKGVFAVATVEMFLGTGVVKQTSVTHATKAFPVEKIQKVSVRDRGGLLLVGEF